VVAALAAGPLPAQDVPERTVAGVAFAGNRAIDDYTLGASIVTSPPRGFFLTKLFGGGERQRFDEVEFRRDVLRIQLLYRRYGFFEARVDTVVRRGADRVRVRFQITEGPPVIVDTVLVHGVDSLIGTRALLRRVPVRIGRPFNRFAFDAGADTLAAMLRNRGYPFPEVFRNYEVDRLTRLARVEYDVLPGPLARIGEIVTDGQTAVTQRTLRRATGLNVGDRFSQRRLTDAQLSLYRTDMFRYASVAVAPDSLVGGVDSLVRVRLRVFDGPRTRLRTGVGYGTYDCLRTQAQFSWVNFTGGARRLDVTGNLSKLGAASPGDLGFKNSICRALSGDRFSNRVNYFSSITITQPSLLGRPVELGLSVFAERASEYNAYERSGVGGVLSAGIRPLRVPLTLAYRVERSRTIADPATFCIAFDQCDAATVAELQQARLYGSVSATVTSARVDQPFNPTSGRTLTAQVALAQPVFQSDIAFTRLFAEGAWYQRLGRGWVLAGRLRGGVVDAGRLGVQDTTLTFIPPTERFYAGGPNTVRGFSSNAMGPVVYVADSITGPLSDPASVAGLRGSPLGSSGIALGNLELRMPSPVLPERLGFVVFMDAGQLWDRGPGGLVASGLRITPGAGIRIYTPLGPMRMDVGYNRYGAQAGRLYEVSGTQLNLVAASYAPPVGTRFLDRLTLQFSVGQAF